MPQKYSTKTLIFNSNFYFWLKNQIFDKFYTQTAETSQMHLIKENFVRNAFNKWRKFIFIKYLF